MQNRVKRLLSYFDVVIEYKLYVWLVSNSMRLKNMNENYFRLKTLAISWQQEQKQRKQNQESDAATLVKAKENVKKNDITKHDLKFVSDAFWKCLK